MEGYDWTFERGRKPDFDATEQQHRLKAFGVDYIRLRGMQSGDLYVTRHGWPLVESLVPQQWFVGQRFSRVGRALAGATGAVYRVPVPHHTARDLALVVKFCRFGQDTLVTEIDPSVVHDAQLRERFAQPEFLSPFEEFGNLMALRRGGHAIATKRPLAIYVPGTRYLDWELGRKGFLKTRHSARLRASQQGVPEAQQVDYDWERMYVLLYGWIDGLDAVQARDLGLLSEQQLQEITEKARIALFEAGWVVLDHKPRHVIVRPCDNASALRCRQGQPIWAIVDYELLLPL